jgi:restriction system protein
VLDLDLSNELPERWQDFNAKFRPLWLEKNPGKSKIAAGLACGFIHTVCKGIKEGDIVLCPNGSNIYWVGEVTSAYSYQPGTNLPHRREVRWLPITVERAAMSVALKNSSGSIGTVSNISQHAEELEALIGRHEAPTLISTNETVEDPTVFALEKHLEEFLVSNWQYTELGKKYDIYTDEGEVVGQQYPSYTDPIDILAISKDGKELLIVELKRGRASDVVVGQIQRYMGYVMEELTEPGQTVRGIIIALEDDLKIRRALRAANNIDFYRYQVSFKLTKG